MKKAIMTLSCCFIAIVFISCASTSTTFIEIKEPDRVYEYGEVKYKVNPGDILEVMDSKTCRSGSGVCWKVRNTKTGEWGYVFSERMEKRHKVYESQSQKVVANDSPIIVKTSLPNVSQSDIERVKREGEKALNTIYPILGIKKKKRIKIKIVEGGICRARNGVVFLPIRFVTSKRAVIVHEVTHIVAKHENNRFFSEGLAVYFQERFGEDKGFPNFLVPLDELVRTYEAKLMGLTNLAKNNEIFRQVGTEKRRIAYIQAGSFINFLVEAYGEQKLADLHNSWTLKYKKIYGKNIEELEVEWKKFVFM